MKTAFIFSAALLTGLTLAPQANASGTPSMLERFKAYKKSCTKPPVNKSGKPLPLYSCEFTKMNEGMGVLSRDLGDLVRDPLSRYMVWGQKGFVSALRASKSALSTLDQFIHGAPEANITGDDLASMLAQDLRRTSAKLKLSECQRVCLAVCATQQLLKYDFKRFGEQMQIPALLESGEGGCRAQSELTLWETRELGIQDSYQVAGMIKDSEGQGPHSWLQVTFEHDKPGKTYWVNTSAGDCTFLETP